MPRSTHPIDAVQRYFRTADLPAAELALHVARGIVRDRQAQGAKGPETSQTPVKKRTRGPNKPKAATPAPGGAKKAPAVPTGQTVEQPGELVGARG